MRRAVLAGVLLAAPWSISASAAELFPDAKAYLDAARYAPAQPAFEWTAWAGAEAGLLGIGPTTFYLTTDFQTVLGSEKRTFDPNQVAYHLEPGLQTTVGPAQVALFFHHVSRHLVDRSTDISVSWNILGASVTAPLPGGAPGHFSASVGRATQSAHVKYRWELTASLEAEPLRRPSGGLYVFSSARLVTTRPTEVHPRDRFLDLLVEAGIRLRRAGRGIEVYAAFERRNDALVLEAAVRERALFGLRLGFSASSSPPPAGAAGPRPPYGPRGGASRR